MRNREDPLSSNSYNIQIVRRRVPDVAEKRCEIPRSNPIEAVKPVPVEKHILVQTYADSISQDSSNVKPVHRGIQPPELLGFQGK